MTVNDIVKSTIQELTSSGVKMTPKNYLEKFCQIANDGGFSVEDCNELDKYLSKLSPSLQEDFNKHSTKKFSDFITYLVSTINRLNTGDASKQNLILITLTKRLLQTITFLHDKEATELANISLDRIEYLSDINSFEIIKDKWFDFLTSYDDSYLKKLDVHCSIKSNNLEDIVDSVVECITKNSDISLFENLVNLLVASLNPSIANSVDDELATLGYELKNSPLLLTTLETQEKLKSLIKRRIKLDREELNSKTSSLNGILDELFIKILALMEQSNVSKDKISIIKNELKSEDKNIDFTDIKDRLITLASSLELEATTLSSKMKKDSHMVQNLQKRVHRLELALNKAKKESKLDFLTNTLSKRALDSELRIAEEAYNRYKIEYTLVFFDLDNFKMVNDTYGHDAGDLILRDLGKILNQNRREVDSVGRFGGEEFLAILPKTSLEGAIIFANKVREAVENYSFLYKDERIFITISAGLASRVDSDTKEETVENADRMLYNSKNLGRNRVSPSIV